MKNSLVYILIGLSLLLGAYGALKHTVPVTEVTQQQPGPVGASASPDHYNYEQFFAGSGSAKYFGISSVSASSSSTTNASVAIALGAGASGQITLGTTTPSLPFVFASTTAATLNSMIFVQATASTTIPGVTCNTTPPTSTVATVVFASTTNLSLNGFKVLAGSVPTTNPICYDYWILDKSR